MAGIRLIIARAALAVTGALVLVLFAAPEASAQDSHWGVGASFTPGWTLAERVRDLLADEGETLNIEGTEFTIGLVRGSTLGGDWGVSFVRKPWKDGLGLSSSDTNCFSPGNNQPEVCLRSDEQTLFNQVMLDGVEFHWFIAPGFARIKDRVQFGANIAGGIAQVKGSVTTIEDEQRSEFIPGPGGGSFRIVNVHSEETRDAKDELFSMFPLGKVEFMGAAILAPGFKIKAAWGLNFPGTGFRVAAIYLFGA
jgi:hypothetical protein